MNLCVKVLTLTLLISIGDSKPNGGLGFAYNQCDDLTTLKPNWYYNWNYTKHCTNYNKTWIPMIKNETYVQYAETLKGKNYEAVLGFNEPDANANNMSVKKALELWPTLMDTGLRLCSPAPTRGGWFDKWLIPFMQGIQNNKSLRVDFLCLHFYVRTNETVEQAIPILDSMLKNLTTTPEFSDYTKDGKIWITEFADHHNNVTGNMEFLDKAYDLFTNKYSDMIGRYAWFTNRQSPNFHKNNVNGTYAWDLINQTGNITKLGKDWYDKLH